MGKRTDLAVTDDSSKSKDHSFLETTSGKTSSKEDTPDEVSALLVGIENTRGEMSRTVSEIEERLSPAHMKEQIANVKDSLLSNYHEAKDHIKEDIAQEVRVAKDKVKEEISEAKQLVKDEIEHAKEAVHDATIGKVKHLAEDAKNMAVDAGQSVKNMAVDAGQTVKHIAVDAGQTVKHVAVGAGHSVSDAGSTVASAIRRNPIPAALIAVGAGWLAVSLLRSRSSTRTARAVSYDGGYAGQVPAPPALAVRSSIAQDVVHKVGHVASDVGHRVGETASHLGQQVSQTAQGVSHKVGEVASKVSHTVADQAHHVYERAQETTHLVGERVTDLRHRAQDGAGALVHGAVHGADNLAHEAKERGAQLAKEANRQLLRAELTVEESYMANPLPYGALTLAVGAAIGLALPNTAREDAWIGETKDRLMDSAGHLAHDALHAVQEKASAFTQSGRDDARNASA